MKSNFKTIDSALYPKHLFQMTVSPSHSINLAGLNAAMTSLGLMGKPPGPQPCTLYFAVPPDVFPIYQHKPGSMVPSGSLLPNNVTLMVLEIPLPRAPSETVFSTSAPAAPATGGKRKQQPEDVDTVVPLSKKPTDTRRCDCCTGCTSGRCKCYKHGNKCGASCHTAAAPASATACTNH
jgi:hypothetical protein